jgi:hypothetical protein
MNGSADFNETLIISCLEYAYVCVQKRFIQFGPFVTQKDIYHFEYFILFLNESHFYRKLNK